MFSSAPVSTFGSSSRQKTQYYQPTTPPSSTYYPNPHHPHPSESHTSFRPLPAIGAFSPASSVASGSGAYDQPGCTSSFPPSQAYHHSLFRPLPTPANSSPLPQPTDDEADDEADSDEEDEEVDGSPMYSHEVSLASPEASKRGVLSPPWIGGVDMNGNMKPFSAEAGSSKLKNQPEMFMAPEGHETGMATISTPLAAFVASTLIWIWFGDHTSAHSPHVYPTPPHDGSSPDLALDPFQSSQIDQHQIHPAPQFSNMVSDILHRTSISHSVTLLGLLYVYRLKRNNRFISSPGSEIKPFITGLMLANKYLDDNTYTNKTWAELAGMSVKEVNSMEKEFLQGLQYRLQVTRQDYLRWKSMLDGYITSRQRQQNRLYHPISLSQAAPSQPLPQYGVPGSLAFSGQAAVPVNYAPAPIYDYVWPAGQRARSASPPWVETYGGGPLGGSAGRKRTREDAFVMQHAHNLSVPSISVPQLVAPPHPDLATRPSASRDPSLSRSSSLTRQVARIPRESPAVLARRGSASGLLAMDQPMDLRHLAAQQSQAQALGFPADDNRRASIASWYPDSEREHDLGFSPEWASYQPQVASYQALGAPYDLSAAEARHRPTTLDFVSLAADPHPGYDGARRKGVLRYQEAQPQVYDPASGHVYTLGPDGQSYVLTGYMAPGDMALQSQSHSRHSIAALTGGQGYHDGMDVDAYGPPAGMPLSHSHTHTQGPALPIPLPHPAQLPPSQSHSHYAEPQPALFANAGPPGYAYRPNPGPAPHGTYGFPHAPLTSVPGAAAHGHGSNRWSWGSDDPGFYYAQTQTAERLVGSGQDESGLTAQMAQYGLGIAGVGAVQMEQRARSQYSSPMPRWEGWMGQG